MCVTSSPTRTAAILLAAGHKYTIDEGLPIGLANEYSVRTVSMFICRSRTHKLCPNTLLSTVVNELRFTDPRYNKSFADTRVQSARVKFTIGISNSYEFSRSRAGEPSQIIRFGATRSEARVYQILFTFFFYRWSTSFYSRFYFVSARRTWMIDECLTDQARYRCARAIVRRVADFSSLLTNMQIKTIYAVERWNRVMAGREMTFGVAKKKYVLLGRYRFSSWCMSTCGEGVDLRSPLQYSIQRPTLPSSLADICYSSYFIGRPAITLPSRSRAVHEADNKNNAPASMSLRLDVIEATLNFVPVYWSPKKTLIVSGRFQRGMSFVSGGILFALEIPRV